MLQSPTAAGRRRHATSRASPSSESSKRSQIVIEVGTASTKCGVAREATPRATFPTPATISRLLMHRPPPVFEEELQCDISDFLHLIVFQKLCYPVAGRIVVLCWNANCNERILSVISKLLVDNFSAKAVHPICTQLCALYPTESTTGLVLDCGRCETRCVAVEHGVPLLAQARYVPLGAETVVQALRQRLAAEPAEDEVAGRRPVEEALRVFSEPAGTGTAAPALGGEGLSCLDVLFDPSLYLEEWSVATPVLEVLLACPVVRRAAVVQNVVVCGSLADLPGFRQRVMCSIVHLCRSQRRYFELQGLLKRMALSLPAVPARHVAWTGASLAAAVAAVGPAPAPAAAPRPAGHSPSAALRSGS